MVLLQPLAVQKEKKLNCVRANNQENSPKKAMVVAKKFYPVEEILRNDVSRSLYRHVAHY